MPVLILLLAFGESSLWLLSAQEAVQDSQLQTEPVIGRVTVTESAGYLTTASSTATRTETPLRDVPQSVTVVTQSQMRDQLMMSVADVVRYIPGVTAHQGENNRDQLILRGNNSSADFFVNGVRDDVQYFRDLYNLERVEVLKGPNAMIFGRGGGGGVVNRVTKEAGELPLRELSILGGMFGNRRISGDFSQPLGTRAAFRLNGVFENSNSFRHYGNLDRRGLSPTLSLQLSPRTRAVLQFEHFRDHRVADRGISSFGGRPLDVDFRTYFGNPDDARVRAAVSAGAATLEHQRGKWNFRNRTHVGSYDRYYRNYVPGAVTVNQLQVAISAYDNATQRLNVFNQTDAVYTGPRHTLLLGAEAGHQATDNLRNTGYFGDRATSVLAPLSDPVLRLGATFRHAATDADNHVTARIGAVYMQEQISLTRWLRVVGGVRVDRFALRVSPAFARTDTLLSPRIGVMAKRFYANYSVSYLPSAGDQFASLTAITQQLKPERFTNYEAGVKWEFRRSLSLTAAVYRLDRTNTRSVDPSDPTRIVQTGSQRTNGAEVGWTGTVTRRWEVAGGVGVQDAFVTSATASARAGATVAQVPRATFAAWNNFRVRPRLGVGLGVVNRSDMFAAIDNSVRLPGYARVDAAVYYSITEKIRFQANAENLLNRRYFANADNNTNISPGAPLSLRMGLTMRF